MKSSKPHNHNTPDISQHTRTSAILQKLNTDDASINHSTTKLNTTTTALQQRIPVLNDTQQNIIFNQLIVLRNSVYGNNDATKIHSHDLHHSTMEIITQWLHSKLLNSNYIKLINSINTMIHITNIQPTQQLDINNVLIQYCIDRYTLSQLGIKPELIDRLYRGLWVYSAGLHEIISEIVLHCNQKNKTTDIITGIWQCYGILLQDTYDTNNHSNQLNYDIVLLQIERKLQSYLQHTHDTVHQRIQVYIQQQTASESFIKQLQEKLSKQKYDLDMLHTDYNTLNETIDKLNNQVNQQQHMIETLNNEKSSIAEQLKQCTCALNDMRVSESIGLQQHTTQIDSMKHILDELNHTNQDYHGQINKLQLQYDTLRAEYTSMQTKLRDTVNNLLSVTEHNTQLNSTVEQLNKQQHMSNVELQNIQRKYSNLSSQLDVSEQSRMTLLEQLKQRKHDYSQYNSNNNNQHSDKPIHAGNTFESTVNRNSAEQQVQLLTQQYTELQAQYTSTQQQCIQLTGVITDMKKSMTELNNEIYNAQQLASAAVAERDATQQAVQSQLRKSIQLNHDIINKPNTPLIKNRHNSVVQVDGTTEQLNTQLQKQQDYIQQLQEQVKLLTVQQPVHTIQSPLLIQQQYNINTHNSHQLPDISHRSNAISESANPLTLNTDSHALQQHIDELQLQLRQQSDQHITIQRKLHKQLKQQETDYKHTINVLKQKAVDSQKRVNELEQRDTNHDTTDNNSSSIQHESYKSDVNSTTNKSMTSLQAAPQSVHTYMPTGDGAMRLVSPFNIISSASTTNTPITSPVSSISSKRKQHNIPSNVNGSALSSSSENDGAAVDAIPKSLSEEYKEQNNPVDTDSIVTGTNDVVRLNTPVLTHRALTPSGGNSTDVPVFHTPSITQYMASKQNKDSVIPAFLKRSLRALANSQLQ